MTVEEQLNDIEDTDNIDTRCYETEFETEIALDILLNKNSYAFVKETTFFDMPRSFYVQILANRIAKLENENKKLLNILVENGLAVINYENGANNE